MDLPRHCISSRPLRASAVVRALLAIIALPPLLFSAAWGAVIDVDTTADDFIDNGNCTLREAIFAANSNLPRDGCSTGSGADTIRLPAGLYLLDLTGSGDNFAADGDLDVRGDLVIEGADAELTVIDGAADERVFDIDPGNAGIAVALRRLTVRNGASGALTGGGIQNKGDLVLEDVVVSDNRTDGEAGGGIYNLAGTLTLERVILARNSGDDGGGLFVEGGTTVAIRESVLRDNTSATSAGAINNNGTTTIDRSLIQDNTASTVKGGGIVNNDTMTIRNSTISGNRAPAGAGGAIRNEGMLTLEHTTIALNSAATGGAISNFDTVNAAHTILALNSPDNCADDPLSSGGFNLEDRDDCGLGTPAPGPDFLSTDPQLEPLADNGGPTLTHALPASSPAVDSGDDGAGCDGLDERGAPRNFDGDGDGTSACDIGAFELRPPLVVNSTADAVDADPGDGVCETATGNGICTLRAAIQETNGVQGLEDVVLPAGTYTLTLAGPGEDLAASGDLDIRDSLRLLGAGVATTVVDGGGLDRVFDLVDVGIALMPGLPQASATLSDLTIRNGDAGGGLRSNSTALLRRVDVRENQGQGIYLSNPGELIVLDSSIRDNQASGNGGGLFTEFGSRAVLRRSTISGNQGAGSGGGGELDGEGVLENVTVSGNTSNNGGGLFADRITILSSTIAGNTATGGSGGGLFLIGPTLLHNTIVASNVGSPGSSNCVNSGAVVLSHGFNLEDDDTCELTAASDRLHADPMLAPLASQGGLPQTLALLAGSPALETGDPGDCPTVDGRGFTRPVDGDNDGTARCDRGAYEVQIRTFTVDTAADGADANPGDGVCATAGGRCTLRSAVQEANAWGGTDEIVLPAGTFTLTLSGTGEDESATGDLDIDQPVRVRGAGARKTIIDGNQLDRVFDIVVLPAAPDLHLSFADLTLRNGFSGEYGAGVRANIRGTLRFSDAAVLDNTAAGSGGREGGGIYLGYETQLELERSLVAGNVATDGGGIYATGSSTVTLSNTTLSQNQATGSPGFGKGGGLYLGSFVDATLVNVAVVGNHADLEGGGIYTKGTRPLLDNTIVAANTATNCSPLSPESAGFNLEDRDDCGLNDGADLTSLINTDPLLGPLADNGGQTDTHALSSGSPAIDGGHDPSCTSRDQRGVSRPLDGDGDGVARCDIGPYEWGLFADGFETGDTSAWSARSSG